MQQFDGKPGAAADSFAALEASLPAELPPDDAILTAASRRKYKLLGSPLPAITTWAWLLQSSTALPRLGENLGAGTELFLFPEWCAQCVEMGKQFMFAALNLNQSDVRFFGMLAQTSPPAPDAKPATVKAAAPHIARPGAARADASAAPVKAPAKPTPAELLSGTPTLIVPSETVDAFVATDFPLVIATDHEGIVRAMIVAPQTALVPGGLVEQLAAHILSRWPPPAKVPAAAKAPAASTTPPPPPRAQAGPE
jgi:hypothetical protein